MPVVKPSPHIEALILARRGRLRAYEHLDYGKVALLVIDMQNVFVASGGLLRIPQATHLVDKINLLARCCRQNNIPVIWLRHTTSDESLDLGLHSSFFSKETLPAVIQNFTPGSWGHDFWPEMEVQKQDVVINKCRFSALAAGSSALNMVLKSLDKDTVIICGVRTNVCCESTARDAMMAGFKVLFISDAIAGINDEEHQATLNSIAITFGDVIPTEEVVTEINAWQNGLAKDALNKES